MKMANIGIGVGAFSQGLLNGIQMGREIKKIRNENEINTIRREGLSQAKALRDAQIESSVKRVPGADGATSQFQVGDQTFASRDEARAVAGRGVESVMDTFMSTVSPRIYEAYIAQGDIEKAEIWNNWSQGQTGKRAIGEWAKGRSAAQRGDWGKAAEIFGNYYSRYVDPDVEFAGFDTLKAQDGSETGFTLKVKDKKSGKLSELPITPEDIIEFGNAHNPQALFETAREQLQTADRARLEDAKAERKYDREQAGRIELERERARLRETSQNKPPAEVQTAQWLLESGVARSAPEAWRLSKAARSKGRQEFALEYAKMVTQGEKDNYSIRNKSSPEQALQQGLEAYDRLLSETEGAPDPASPAGAAAGQGVIFDSRTNQFVPIR